MCLKSIGAFWCFHFWGKSPVLQSEELERFLTLHLDWPFYPVLFLPAYAMFCFLFWLSALSIRGGFLPCLGWFGLCAGNLWTNKSFIFTWSNEVFQAFGTKISFLLWLLPLLLMTVMVCRELLCFWSCFCVQLVLPDVNWSVYSSQDRLIPLSPQLNTWSSALFTD